MKSFPFVRLFLLLLLTTGRWLPAFGQTPPLSATTAEAFSFEGTVVDAATRQPLAGVGIVAKNGAGAVSAEQRTGANGAFNLPLGPRQSYVVTFATDGYHTLSERLEFTSVHVNRLAKVIRMNRTLPPQPVASGQPVSVSAASAAAAPFGKRAAPVATASAAAAPSAAAQSLTPPKTLDAKVIFTPPLVVAAPGKVTQLRAIQFVQSKAELLPDAQPALEQLLTYMKAHPTAEIALAGHTDNQGDFDENVRLSQQRVDVVKAYLVSNGIAANRISARGYGPTRPLATNNYEAGRQQNRRVELTVLKE